MLTLTHRWSAILVVTSALYAVSEAVAQPSAQSSLSESPAFCVLKRVSNLAPPSLFEDCGTISEAEFEGRLCRVTEYRAFAAGLSKGMAARAPSTAVSGAPINELSECRNDLDVALSYLSADRDVKRRLDKVRDCLMTAKQYAFNPSMNAALSQQVTECASLVE